MMITFLKNDHQMMMTCSTRCCHGSSQRAAVLTTCQIVVAGRPRGPTAAQARTSIFCQIVVAGRPRGPTAGQHPMCSYNGGPSPKPHRFLPQLQPQLRNCETGPSAGTAWPNFRGAPLVWVSGLSGGAPSLKTSSFWWGWGRGKFSFP